MVNAEKKYVESNIVGNAIGQLQNGSDGVQCLDITPLPAVGNTFQQRNGNSIKLSGLYFRGQVLAQTNLLNSLTIKMTIVIAKGMPQTPTQIVIGMYDIDSLTGLRDINCSRNPAQFSDYRIITERTIKLHPDNITGQQAIYNFHIPLKLTHHIRWNTSNVVQEGQMYLLLRASNGDSGSPATGAFFSSSSRLSYYDN